MYFTNLSVRQNIGAVPCLMGGSSRPVYVNFRAHFSLVHLGFVGDTVAVGQVFLRVLRWFISPELSIQFTWCGGKVVRLATLCTNRQHCCLLLHMAFRLTPAVDSVKVWTCYSCYAIVESVWSEVVFVRCVTKMDRQNFEQRCAIKFCVKLGESSTVTYKNYKGLMENIPYPGHKCSDGTSPL